MTLMDDNSLIELKADIRKSQVQAGVEVNKVML